MCIANAQLIIVCRRNLHKSDLQTNDFLRCDERTQTKTIHDSGLSSNNDLQGMESRLAF